MPVTLALHLKYSAYVTEQIIRLLPPDINVFMDTDNDRFGAGLVRFTLDYNPDGEKRPERACWACVVTGNSLMITFGDLSNFSRFKHDYITPHHDGDMDAHWMNPIQNGNRITYNYETAASIIITWLLFGVKLKIH